MVFSPLEAFQALSGFQRLDTGDLLLTGTPVGTALSVPRRSSRGSAACPPAHVKWKAFFKRQASNLKYLQHGDLVEVGVAADDGLLDLGTQPTVVRHA